LPAGEGGSEAEISVAKVASLSPYVFKAPSDDPGLVNVWSRVDLLEGRLAPSATGAGSVGIFPFVPVLLSALHDLSLTVLYCAVTTGMSKYVDCGEPCVNIVVKVTLDSDNEITPGSDTTLGHFANKK
jgi:hypothetical protein